MHTILYLGSTSDLAYERQLLSEWGKRSVRLATAATAHAELAATGTDSAVAMAETPDPLADVDAVVIEHGELTAHDLGTHPDLTVVVLLNDRGTSVDVAAATEANVWVTRATNRKILMHVPHSADVPSRSTRRHALQDALAGMSGERPSGRINEL